MCYIILIFENIENLIKNYQNMANSGEKYRDIVKEEMDFKSQKICL